MLEETIEMLDAFLDHPLFCQKNTIRNQACPPRNKTPHPVGDGSDILVENAVDP